MIVLDAQLPPSLAPWIKDSFDLECVSTRFINLENGSDRAIFLWAKSNNAIVMTKDIDFINLQIELGSPPKVIWLTIGNTSKLKLKEILKIHLLKAVDMLKENNLVEISN
jgi:predicted nuclease of predicted toxin-antitoxin system